MGDLSELERIRMSLPTEPVRPHDGKSKRVPNPDRPGEKMTIFSPLLEGDGTLDSEEKYGANRRAYYKFETERLRPCPGSHPRHLSHPGNLDVDSGSWRFQIEREARIRRDLELPVSKRHGQVGGGSRGRRPLTEEEREQKAREREEFLSGL